MKAHIDTSILAVYYCPEALSVRAEAALRRIESPLISVLCEAELASTLSRKVRERSMNRGGARLVLERFAEHLAGGYYGVVQITNAQFEQARHWLAQLNAPLRTLDAIHLAVSHQQAAMILSADGQLARAARKLGCRARLLRSSGK